jgi:uroporphyrinogen decarboxylase
VDVVFYGDDVAIQNGPLLAPEMYRKFVKPWHQKVFDGIRAYTQARILYHSCGSVYSLIPDLIDLGIDALNPVQVSAAQMGDTAHLKREFGGRLAFWGGIDTHRVLPRGTPEEVREEVRRRIRDLAPGGGYVLNSVHNIQREVPPENVVALFEAAQEYGVY